MYCFIGNKPDLRLASVESLSLVVLNNNMSSIQGYILYIMGGTGTGTGGMEWTISSGSTLDRTIQWGRNENLEEKMK